MTTDQLVASYLKALEASDLDGVLALFAPSGTVHSPLYGTLPPQSSIRDCSRHRRIETYAAGHDGRYRRGRTVVSFWFNFDWVLSNGEPAPFAVVDVAELTEHGLIDNLHIVYDTAPLRDSFNNLRKKS